MKKVLLFSALLISLFVMVPPSVRAEQKPEMIGEQMAVKLVRGLANTAFCFIEIPKQIDLTVSSMGGVGLLVGPLKGVGMTIYRAGAGVLEMVFFMVPQPGFYDPLIDPPYVWDAWESQKTQPEK